jgi:hypothetical protein
MMIVDKTKKYRTRAGLPVRIYATDSGGMYPVQGAIWHSLSQRWVVELWTSEGKCFGPSTVDGKHDLIEVKEENWAYFLLYELGKCECRDGFTSEEEAKEALGWAILNWQHNASQDFMDFMGYQKIVQYGISKLENVTTKSG